MIDRLTRPITGNRVLLFGPQALSFDEEAFQQIRTTVLETEEHRWILDTIAELPQCLEALTRELPKFYSKARQQSLEDMIDWFKGTTVTKKTFFLPNVLLNPLVIIAQLTDYANYLDISLSDSEKAEDIYSSLKIGTETLGFCTGFLSAVAVSCSRNKTQIQKYGAVALRVGMLIGMVVDAQDESIETGESKSLAIVWNSPATAEAAVRIVKSFPEAYFSVEYDENRATVTTSTKSVAALQQQLRAASIIATEVGLRGRFHWERHRDDIDALISFCDSNEKFQFPDASALVIPTRSSSSGQLIRKGQLHHEALNSILTEAPQWFKTFSAMRSSSLEDKDSLVISFGPERCVPPSIMRALSPQVVHMADVDCATLKSQYQRPYSENDIAVVGMSCKVAGAEDVEDFWKLLCEGKSQHVEVPKERFLFDTVHREVDSKRKWFGNFMEDYDKFDHKFFKKSPREITSTDPQQRHFLQIAYQAVEQSGYFRSKDLDQRIGCYVGVCATDYENNIACHAPNAFSATGNLRGFIAGKVSHFFGWTGPGLTIDTACSSSAVAVHQACQSILSGECNAALAGGTHVMTNPLWYQNLAGANFLSTTGACKPFDAKADGYCRGEGVAAVFLKKMSTAIADGDQILGTIAATAVQQNQNTTPIFVPNAPSLSNLFQIVTRRAGLKAEQISVVEAHGTGTPIGDPAEYESIRKVLGGSNRTSPLMLSSVKGLVGHVECTSGLVSLIKTILMIQKGAIPPQASFTSINPSIKATAADHMQIPTSIQPWKPGFRAALINNYGASGSNASIVVTEAPLRKPRLLELSSSGSQAGSAQYPFWFCGLDERSLRAYAAALRKYLKKNTHSARDLSVPNMAFNMSRQSNRSLDRGLVFSARSITELDQKLASFEIGDSALQSIGRPTSRPVILCFGGQISTFVGLNRHVYDSAQILRTNLDRCNSMCLSLGVGSLFPAIFQRSPIEDPVKLQSLLFSMQYACAKSWMDCGIEVVAVLGHSFGELTALCISGVLSLEDTLKMIIGRATVIKEHWGSEKGAMMAVEADLNDVQNLLVDANQASSQYAPASIACFNGPRSFTLAGSTQAIDAAADIISNSSVLATIRFKKLNVSYAFHSALVDPLMPLLEESARDLKFQKPTIPIGTATGSGLHTVFTPKFIAEHMRQAVLFDHSVQRLAKEYPSCIWLEAGSQSTITNMASRALGSSASHFQAVDITSDSSLDKLTDTTMKLWKAGLNVTFWAHHSSQTYDHTPLLLPPYQFEKVRHWMALKQAPKAVAKESVVETETHDEKLPDTLLTFVGYNDKQGLHARYRINTMIPKYDRLLSGHIIAQTAAICPATVQIDLAIEGVRGLREELVNSQLEPQVLQVENQSPICLDPSRTVWLDLQASNTEFQTWTFKIGSTGSAESDAKTSHTTGKIVFRSTEDLQTQLEWARYERVVGHRRCLDVLNCSNADDLIQGRNIYRTFSEIVDYGEDYRGLQKLVGRGSESAGRVVKKYNSESWLDAHLADAFCQVGGIWVNCMTDRSPNDMYIANGIEQWIRSPRLRQTDARPESWDVLAYHHGPLDNSYLTDIFVFDPTTGALMEAIQGIKYVRVAKRSMSKMLSHLTKGDAINAHPGPALHKPAQKLLETNLPRTIPPPAKPVKAPKLKKENKQPSRPDVSGQVKEILADLSGLNLDEIKNNSELADLGIDSLMGMEMAREIETLLKCTLDSDRLVEVTDMPGLMRCVNIALGASDDNVAESESDDDTDSSTEGQNSNDQIFTPLETISSSSGTPNSEVDILGFLAEFLGIEVGDMAPKTILRDLGVDSLLSTELRHDLATQFNIELSEDVVIEELTVEELSNKTNGSPNGGSSNLVSAVPSKQETADRGVANAHSDRTHSAAEGLVLPLSTVLEAFGETKQRTDQVIDEEGCSNYVSTVIPKQNEMCIALTLEAFEQLGCSIRTIKAGQEVARVTHLPEHERLVTYLYQMLEKEACLIEINGKRMTRTKTAVPTKSSKSLLEDLLKTCPDHAGANELTHYAGDNLAKVLTGKTDGIKLIFASEEGRKLVSSLYGDWPMNRLFYKQMEDFLTRLVAKLPMHKGPLKILEMGAGTGGTTKWLVPLLAKLDVPIEYTFTDLGPSFVAAARKKFKQYPFMKFRTHDIEKAPADDLLSTQHIIVASNAVHATHSLTASTANIRKALRPDGLLMMLEMTGTLYWVDMIFGLFEGWWLFDDGRTHAVSNESRWERDLQSVGYGHVDWTDGVRAENKIEKVIIAMASGSRYGRLPAPTKSVVNTSTDCAARQAVVDQYVFKKTHDFTCEVSHISNTLPNPSHQVILITGATGSLGSHLVANLAMLPHVKTIICLNRRSGQDPRARQLQALITKGIFVPAEGLAKLKVLESDASKPMLGLQEYVYLDLKQTVTHIIHNAWLMSAKRPLKGFESQFHIMRNMIDLARDISCSRSDDFKVAFQFVSSIACVGHYPLWTGEKNVPEERMKIDAVLPNGYGDAKYICELMLDETLHKYPERFRTSAVRIGQIAGSKSSGYWNPMEHLSYLWKSSQTLKTLPNFDGVLSWTPVDDVAGTLVDILQTDIPYPIYHIDNPIRQPWKEMIPVLADALSIPLTNAVPFSDWVDRVRNSGLEEEENPAAKLVDFLDGNFIRMSCGGLLLETTKSREHSKTLRDVTPVSDEVARKFVQSWKDMRFLS